MMRNLALTATAIASHRQRSRNILARKRYLRLPVGTMDTWQNITLEMCCLLAVPLSLLLTVLLAGFILS